MFIFFFLCFFMQQLGCGVSLEKLTLIFLFKFHHTVEKAIAENQSKNIKQEGPRSLT